MNGTFWTHTIWYLILLSISAACFVVTLFKAGNKRFTIAFFLSVVGLVYIMEHILVVYLDAYQYHPGVYGDQAAEDILGNIVSQTSIAATAMLIIIFDLSFIWNVIFAAVYYLIQVLFTYLGIYEDHWYPIWFTPAILVPLFRFFKIWYRLATGSRSQLLHHTDVFLSVGTVLYHSVSIPFLLLGVQWMRIGLFQDVTDDHRAVTLPFGILLAIATILLNKWKAHWAWKILCLGMLLAYPYALYLLGILNVRDGLFLPVAFAYILVSYGSVHLLDIWHRSGNPYFNNLNRL